MKISKSSIKWRANLLILQLFCLLVGIQSLTAQVNNEIPLEKVYLHTDRAEYYSGDDLWFSAYLVDGYSHQPQTLSSVVYVDLIDSEFKIVGSRTIRIKNGTGAGDFEIPVFSESGEFTLRAYTQAMRNFGEKAFFSKRIIVNSLLSESEAPQIKITKENKPKKTKAAESIIRPDIQFLPEGGHMVNGMMNRIGIRSLGSNQKIIKISGELLTGEGKMVSKFSTAHNGMGLLYLMPVEGETYTARITFQGMTYTYNLPQALEKGIVMQVDELTDVFRIGVFTNFESGFENMRLEGSQRNDKVCEVQLTDGKNNMRIDIPKDALNEGIVQFTIYDAMNDIHSERLVYNEITTALPEIEINLNQVLETNKVANIDLGLKRATDARISMAITDASLDNARENGMDIRSYLLINSELQGGIEDSGYYFNTNNPKRKQHLDLLMMTQGWRQYVWNKKSTLPSSQQFEYETGLTLVGYVKRLFSNKKTMQATVSLTYMNDQDMGFFNTDTDKNGRFSFGNLHFNDSTSIIIQATKKNSNDKFESEKKSDKRLSIDVQNFEKPEVLVPTNYNLQQQFFTNQRYLKQLRETRAFDSLFNSFRDRVSLQEVILTNVLSKKEQRRKEKRRFFSNPTHSIYFDEIDIRPNDDLFEAIYNYIPGATRTALINRGASTFVGDQEPLYMVNGFAKPKLFATSIPVSDIDFVDIFKGSSAARFGVLGAEGVIAIYTLDGADMISNTDPRTPRGITNLIHPGYSQARKFYEPGFEGDQESKKTGQLLATVYWEPTISLQEGTTVPVSFKTGDVAGRYRIRIEGITSKGQPLSFERIIDVGSN